MNNKFRINILFAMFAQGMSMFVGIVTNLILPKLVTTLDYSYWQLFLFYCTYIPILSFGLTDGIYLRFGGMSKNKLKNHFVKDQFIFGFLYQLSEVMILGLCIFFFSKNRNLTIVLLFVLLYFLTYTAFNFLSNIFQAVNETSIFSKSVILQKVFFIIAEIIIIYFTKTSIILIIFSYILAIFVSVMYLFYNLYSDFGVYKFNFFQGAKEVKESINQGWSLLISNLCSFLVLGTGRQIIASRWGLLVFGKVSFSLTLMNFALSFISQISMVLFPALRKMDKSKQKEVYSKISSKLYLILPLMYIFYFPIKILLILWLPKYDDSIIYLSLMLPICYFDCKMEIISNTFFKVLNKQKLLLKINLTTFVLGSLLCVMAAYLLNNLVLVMTSMVVSIFLRSIVSSCILNKYFNFTFFKIDVLDFLISVSFVFCSNFYKDGVAFTLILFFYVMRIIYFKGKIDFIY